uniref:Uncharacterized protein n=1 Tax=Anguilla anguilla TaxID=7936 RepID=A0A0E9PDU0_ANGAN
MWRGRWTPDTLLKSITISFVLEVLRTKLLSLHHSARCSTSSL